MSRIPMIAGNWKMHKTVAEAVRLAAALRGALGNLAGREVMIAPPCTALSEVARELTGSSIHLGAQNMYPEDSGAFTGEIAPAMLRSVGCSHVILGHSERRQIFNESDDFIARKVAKALATDLTPVLCVGETLPEREAETAVEVVSRQLRAALKGLTKSEALRIIIAYEPVWAIGTGRTATPDIAQEMHATIRRLLQDLFSDPIAAQVRILYGGSVKPENISALMAETDIDGALVGGASLKAEDFIQIVEYT
ncbi:MAG: triose-phosphate isomerase [Acidobacteria bacterium]|nr:triose-phosphate isomerase [Acidobacteriota bacterium]